MNKTHRDRECVCLLPPSIPGSLGDEKAMRTCVQVLKQKLIILNYERGSWDFIAPEAESISQFGRTECTAYYHARGWKKVWSLTNSLVHLLWNFPIVLGAFWRSKRLVILGMDVMDGHYGLFSVLHKIVLAYVATFLGVQVDIINCSFNTHPSRVVVFALRNLPKKVRIIAREPESHTRMTKFLKRPIALAADITFLYSPEVHSPNSLQQHIDWIQGEKQKGQHVIGLNIADNHNFPTEKLIEMCVRTIQTMQRVSFLLVPHAKYERGNLPNEEILLQKILLSVSDEERGRCKMIGLPCDLADLQYVIRHLDCALSGRMHFALGALAAGVPVCCIEYQDKFHGLFNDYLHMPELLIDMCSAFSEGNFVGPLAALLVCTREKSQRIGEAIPMLQQLAKINF